MRKILVIEDDRIMRTNISELLELSGYDVRSSVDGKEGVEEARVFQPDLIVCDVMMPKLDGYGVLHLLKKTEHTAGIPFIFLTAKSEQTDFRKGMELGADDYLSKPFQDIELLNAIESRLRKHDQITQSMTKKNDEVGSTFEFTGDRLSMDDLTTEYIGQEYNARELLFRDGDHSNYLYYVNKGQVKTYSLNDDGKELITNIFNEGDFFGYQDILEDKPHSEYAEFLKDSVIFKLPRSIFLTLIHEKHEVMEEFVKLLANNLGEKKEELLHMAYSSVRKRIARKLVELSSEHAQSIIDLSRTDMAKLVGTSKETLVRILTELRNEGVIETKGSEVTILDRKKLDSMHKAW